MATMHVDPLHFALVSLVPFAVASLVPVALASAVVSRATILRG